MDFRDYSKNCGTILPSDCRSDWRKFCSRACYDDDKARLISEARREARRGRPCKICGGEIPVELTARHIYGGPACQTKAQRQRVRYWPARANGKGCSPSEIMSASCPEG